MKLIPMKQMLGMTKDAVNTALAPVRAAKIKAKAELAKAKLAEEIIDMETQIQELCTSKEIDFEKLADLIDDVEIREQRQKRFDDILAQLFPATEEAATS